jgi:hypothetical protein
MESRKFQPFSCQLNQLLRDIDSNGASVTYQAIFSPVPAAQVEHGFAANVSNQVKSVAQSK